MLVWLGAAGALVLSMLLPIMAALLERSGPIRVRFWADESGGRLQRLNASAPHLEAFRYLLSFVARLAPLALLVVLRAALVSTGWPRPLLSAAAVVALGLAVAEALNRVLVARDPESALRRLTAAYRVVLVLMAPAANLLAPVLAGPATERREDEDEVSEEEIEAFIDVGTREGILEPGEDDLIMRVIDFGDAVVKSVVTPRTDMVCAARGTSLEELAELFLESKHSRLPLYEESVDRIVGILHIRDLLAALRSPTPASAADAALAPYVVPETKPLNELLREFQSARQQLAIVVDEFGGTVGLVTVEDLLEEIVGEIVDEHEELAEPSAELPDGSWKLDGATPVDALHELFGVDVAREPYETVGGLFFGRLGRLPEAGQEIEALGLSLTAASVEGRRIKSVIARRAPRPGRRLG